MIAKLTIELLSYWQVGSGRGRGADADALVLKDSHGLPYLPGKSLKGLLREGLQVCEDSKAIDPGRTNQWMGTPAKESSSPSKPGMLRLENATLEQNEAEWLASEDGAAARAALYDTVASTKLDGNGMAKKSMLRTIEICVPVTLHALIRGPEIDKRNDKIDERNDWVADLKKACSMTRAVGAHRRRGLGRCLFTISKENNGHD